MADDHQLSQDEVDALREGVRGTALFVFDPKLPFLVVDNLFGSDGSYQYQIKGRDFTTTELRMIRRFLNLALESYGVAWQPVYPFDFGYVRSEMHAKPVNIVAPGDVVVNTAFGLEFEQVGGTLNICISLAMIEPVRGLLSNPLKDEIDIDERWGKKLSQQLQSAHVELWAQILTMQSSIGQLLKLQVGDVLPVETPQTIVATANGVPVMECGYGTANNKYALWAKKMIRHHDGNLSKGNEND